MDISDGRWALAYVCVNLACTSSIILQTRNTADAHPLVRSPTRRVLLTEAWMVEYPDRNNLLWQRV